MKKVVWFFLVLSCLFSSSALIVSASDNADDKGLRFSVEEYYTTEFTDMSIPLTYEATVCLASSNSRGGVIFGSYSDATTPCFNFEIYTNGNPRLYILCEDLEKYEVIFDEVDLLGGVPTHIAITLDVEAGVSRCYVNGELAQAVESCLPEVFTLNTKFSLGGDNREGNAQYFKGEIYDISLYSDVRTPEEIAHDFTVDTPDTDDLTVAYALSGVDKCNISALGDGKYDLTYHTNWINQLPEPENYAYSFAVIGDIQTLNYYHPEKLMNMFEWIRDNKDEKKIAFSVGLGDVTEKNSTIEYFMAIEAYDKIKGEIPFSIIRGNHDRSGYSSAEYDTHITQERYGDEISGSYDGTMLNTYRIIKVGKVKYLFMNLDYILSDEVLAWAGEVIAAHPECHVIVSTHIYMSQTGSYYTLEGNQGIGKKYGAQNNGDGLWDKLISKHENIVMLLCGHNPTDNIYYRQREGVNGNTVTEILIDPQGTDKALGGVGLVAMFYFSEDGEHLDVQYYSTDRDAYFKSNNQFSLELDTPGTVEEDEERGGFFDAIANFFAKIIDWFKNFIGNIFKKPDDSFTGAVIKKLPYRLYA